MNSYRRRYINAALVSIVCLICCQAIHAQEDSKDDGIGIRYVIVDQFEPPVSSLNYFLETAIPLDPGEIYYQNIQLFGQRFGFGITERFSINGGLEIIGPLIGTAPIVFIAPKFTLNDRYDPIKVAFGANLVSLFGSDGLVGTIYGAVTIGNLNNHLTAGLHLGYDSFGAFGIPLIQISGQLRFSNRFGLILDSLNLIDSGEFLGIPAVLGRYMTDRFVIDLGILVIDDFGAGPVANFAIILNR